MSSFATKTVIFAVLEVKTTSVNKNASIPLITINKCPEVKRDPALRLGIGATALTSACGELYVGCVTGRLVSVDTHSFSGVKITNHASLRIRLLLSAVTSYPSTTDISYSSPWVDK